MKKQEIYDIFNEIYKSPSKMRNLTNMILAKIDQEKKDQAIKIFNRIFDDDTAGDLGEFCGYGWIYDIDEAKAIAKEFGVEL